MAKRRETVLLFGATGNIGGHAAEALALRDGVEVRAAVRPSSTASLERLERLGVRIVRADLDDAASLAAAFDGVDAAFLVNSLFALDAMAGHTHAVLAAARAAGVKRIVRSGGAPFPPCPIADLHDAAQAAFCDAGIPWVLVRPNFFDSNLLWSAATIKQHGAFYLPIGDAPVAWTDPRDIGEVVAHALLADGVEGRSFHVTGPESIDGHAVATRLGAAIVAAKRDRHALALQHFEHLDTSRDGRIDRTELLQHLGASGFAPPEVDALLARADTDADGLISLEEFRRDVATAGDVLAASSEVRFVPVDEASAADGLRSAGVPPRAVELLMGLYAKIREGGAAQTGTGVRDALGRDATTVRAWAERNVAAFVPTHWEGLKGTDAELRPTSIG